jgi:hypothetical protein
MKSKTPWNHVFERDLAVHSVDISLTLRRPGTVPWADFLLNPRRLRGSDFLMRWSQGVWSEERLTQAVNATGLYFAMPYGPSGTAPDEDVRAFELYFERLEKAGLGGVKRPDLLIYRFQDKGLVESVAAQAGGLGELPFIPEDDPRMRILLDNAVMAVECENSLWRAKQMPDYGAPLRPQKRLGGCPGLKKSAVLPTIIIKEEDRAPLLNWWKTQGVPLHIWHAFYDEAFGISLQEAEKLIENGDIDPVAQIFQAPGGATTRKIIYKIYHQHAYRLAAATEEPALVADSITDKNGHILPYVRFVGGFFQLFEESLAVLDSLA